MIWVCTVCRKGFKIVQWTTKAYDLFVICAYRGNKYEVIENWGNDFHEMHTRLCRINTFK